MMLFLAFTALLAVLVLLLALAGWAGAVRARVRKHGAIVLLWRWHTGLAHHGHPVTDAGWFRPGKKALTRTGYANRFHHRPRWQRTALRSGPSVAAVYACFGLAVDMTATLWCLAAAALAASAFGCRHGWQLFRARAHRRNYVRPLHVRLAPLAGVPLAARPESWLTVAPDRSFAELTMPKGAAIPSAQDKQALEAGAMATLGMKGAKVTWRHAGPQMSLRLVPPVPCPDRVVLIPERGEDGKVLVPGIQEALQAAGVNDLVLGIGQERKIISVSLANDAPHLGFSMDSGKGKSVTVRDVVPQILFRGGIAMFLDNKLVSHPWARDLPNVAYLDDIDKIHDGLEWLDGELVRRAEFVRAHTDVHGTLSGSPGPRLAVVLEEMNLTMNRLRAYWAERRAEDMALPREDREWLPAVSPAVRGLENASYVGRELKVHLIFISQRMSAKATAGSADVRMNLGIRILAGYDADTWKMLVGAGTPMPAPSRHAGRVQVAVKGGDVTETQVAFLTHAEARQMALGGDVTPLPRGISQGARPVRQPEGALVLAGGGHDGYGSYSVAPLPEPPPAVVRGVTVAEAISAGLLPWKTSAAFRTAKFRHGGCPEPVGSRGTAHVYDPSELADWAETVKSGK